MIWRLSRKVGSFCDVYWRSASDDTSKRWKVKSWPNIIAAPQKRNVVFDFGVVELLYRTVKFKLPRSWSVIVFTVYLDLIFNDEVELLSVWNSQAPWISNVYDIYAEQLMERNLYISRVHFLSSDKVEPIFHFDDFDPSAATLGSVHNSIA